MLLASLVLACAGRLTWHAFQSGPIGQNAPVTFHLFFATEIVSLLLFGFCVACELCVLRADLVHSFFFFYQFSRPCW